MRKFVGVTKRLILAAWSLSGQVRVWIKTSKFLADSLPIFGRPISMILDRLLLIIYGVDVTSQNMFIADLRIPHPTGVLLGGNGLRSNGTVVVNSGVKFVGRSPRNAKYLALHAQKNVFELGHNVVFGTSAVVVGPVSICDNVVIGAMSLVNKDITEPGVYIGCPVQRVSHEVTNEWI